MGLSLRNLGRKITDIFDANSQEDQRKRVAAGQPRMYADQQRAIGNRTPANNALQRGVQIASQTPVGRVVAPVARVVAPVIEDSPVDDYANLLGKGVQIANQQVVKPTVNQAVRATNMINETPLGRLTGVPSQSRMVDVLASQQKDPRTANELRTRGYQKVLDNAGIGINDSKTTIGRKAVSDIGGTAANFVPIGKTVGVMRQAGAPTAKAIATVSAKSGLAGAVGSGLATARETNSPVDIAKGAAMGAVLGGALPVAGVATKGLAKTTLKGAKVSAKATQDAIQAVRNPLKPLNEQGFIAVPDAKSIRMKKAKIDNADVVSAIDNTPGAQMTKDGIELDVSRFQKPEQAGRTSVREGVFYLPESNPKSKKGYSTGAYGYGGTQAIQGRTLVKNPLTVKAATGGRAPELAFDQINGKGAYQRMRTEALGATNEPIFGGRGVDEEKIYKFLEKYGSDPELTWDIIANSKGGNKLPYALQENVVAASLRKNGYDSVLGYSKKRDGTHFLSELFDVREDLYPTPGQKGSLHPHFADKIPEKPQKTPEYQMPDYSGKTPEELSAIYAEMQKSKGKFGLKKLNETGAVGKDVTQYNKSFNVNDKDDAEYLARIVGEDKVKQFQSGDFSHFRGGDKGYYESIVKGNLTSETPKTTAQKLEGRVKPYGLGSSKVYHVTSADNTQSILNNGFKKGSELPESAYRGGGYGQMQDSISFATKAEGVDRFATKGRGVLLESELKPNSKVVEVKGVEYAEDLNDFVPELRKQGVDAVHIGGGENEVVVINPKSIKGINRHKEFDPRKAKDDLSEFYNQPTKNKLDLTKLNEGGYAKIPKTSQLPKVALKQETAPQAPVPENNLVDSLPNNNINAQLQKEILGNTPEVNYKQSRLGTLGETLSPNRQIRKATQAVEGGINKVLRGSLESGNKIVRTPGRTAIGVSRQAGRTPEELAQYGKLQGGKQMGDELGQGVASMGDEYVAKGANLNNVWSALNPELNTARGGKPPTLTPVEQEFAGRLRGVLDLVHESNHNMGLLDDKAYQANKGTYFPRNFDQFFESDIGRQIAKDNKLDLNAFKQRKDLADIPKEVLEKAQTDPAFLTALAVQQNAKNKAIIDHTAWMAKAGGLLDSPKSGYVKVPDSPAYGSIKGKYVLKEQLEDLQGFIYDTETAQHVVALLNTYDRNPARQILKKTKTVYNPGVRLGNRTFNYLTTMINGINPVTYTKNWARGRQMMNSKSPEFLEATKEGVFGSSIIDKELYQIDDALTPARGNMVTKTGRGVDNKITDTYRGVDDKGKMATYLTFRERGLSPAEAAERTRRAMQNYDMVGQFFDLGAKTPIGGSAFVRFSSELMRLAHNSAVDNPLRLASAIAGVVALTNVASKMSGETPQDRKTREERLGAPRVPFTNQSLEVQTPYGAINIGRLLGITTYNDLVGGVQEDAKRLLPFQSPVTNSPDGLKFNPNFVTADPLIGPLMGQAIDKDFRGKSIKDPENNGQFLDKLSTKDQLINRAKTAGMSYIPLANEANSLISSVKGDENFYGKKRSPAQAGLRIAGVKVEQYGPEQAKKQRSIDEYYKDKAAIEKEVATLPKKDQEAYKQATGYYKLREKVPNEFSKGEERYKKAPVYNFSENKWGEYASSPKLYELIKKDKERKAKKGQPIQPEFDNRLSSEFRKQLIANKSLAPGENVEADQRLYSSSEFDTYNKLKDEYKAKAGKYYPERPDGEFTDEMVKHQNAPYPAKGQAKKAYDDAYKAYAQGKGAKPAYTDAVDADKEAYSKAQLAWTNQERKARGLSPIAREVWDNVTFGFQSDEEKVYKELKYGNGYGSYAKGGRKGGSGGGGGSSSPEVESAYKYAIKLKSSGGIPKPKVKAVASKKVKASGKVGKIKVSSKKSLV